MKRALAFGGLFIAGACSLAIVALCAPLLAVLRPAEHTPRIDELGYDDNDPGEDVDS